MHLFPQQFSKNSGPCLLTMFVDLLKNLLLKGDNIELCSHQEWKNAQIESDLLMDIEALTAVEAVTDKV